MSLAFVVMVPVHLIVFTLGLSLVVMTVRSAIRQFVMPRSAPDGLTRNAFLFIRESACRRWRTGGDANRGMLPPGVVAGTAVAIEPGVHNPNGSLIRIPR